MGEIKRTLEREERSRVATDKFARDLGHSNLLYYFSLSFYAKWLLGLVSRPDGKISYYVKKERLLRKRRMEMS